MEYYDVIRYKRGDTLNTDEELKKQHKKIFAKKLNYYMNLNHKQQDDIVNDLGINKSTISTWCRGVKMPRVNAIQTLADYFGVTIADFLDNNLTPPSKTYQNSIISSVSNINPLPKTSKKPRLGVIACGEPILAEENIEDYDDVPDDIKCDFTLLCEGDSMINARIYDGDIVYIREQPQVENGEIAACLVDGEFETKATLKRFYKYDDKIILQSENPAYPPFVYVNEEMNRVRVIGKAVGFTSRL